METGFFELTLVPPSHVVNATGGVFTRSCPDNSDEIVVNLGTHLSLYRHNDNDSKMVRCFVEPLFCHVFSVATISFPESNHDFVALTADSGNITIIDLFENRISKVLSFPFAKTGMRRTEPGFYLTVSPCGRSLFASAIERYKVAWSLAKDSSGKPIISAPIEPARSRAFVFGGCSLDVGFECPKFAFIEKVAKTGMKKLAIYEIDTGINSVLRKAEIDILGSAFHLVQIPGKLFDCPGGVFVCCQGAVQYVTNEGDVTLIPLPMRKGHDLPIIIASATFRKENQWFALLQNQFGDLLIAQSDENGEIEISYFDTVPIATSLVILRQGVLAVFAESGKHCFYYITSVETESVLEYDPSLEMTHLDEFHSEETMTRLTKMVCIPSSVGGISGDLVSVHGSGGCSTLKVTRRGIPVDELYRLTIGGSPLSVMSIRRDKFDKFDSFMLVSSEASTRVFTLSEAGEVKESSDSLFETGVRTLDVFMQSTLTTTVVVQVHEHGMRVLLPDNSVRNWTRKTGEGKIVSVAHNTSQIVMTFSDSMVTLFELDDGGLPSEVSSIYLEGVTNITAVAIPPLQEGIRVAKWIAVATADMVIYIVSIASTDRIWEISARQMANDPVSDMAFLDIPGAGLVLHIGLANGVLMRSNVDETEGGLGTPQMRFLGHSPIRFKPIMLDNGLGLLANSTSPWLLSGLKLSQIATQGFVDATPLTAAFCPDGGFVKITRSEMVFFAVDDMNISVDTQSFPLARTPRQIVKITDTKLFLMCSDIIEGNWSSFGVFFDTQQHQFSEPMHFDSGFAVSSLCYHREIDAILIGLAKNLQFNPRKCDEGRIVMIDANSGTIKHATTVEDIPGAINTFNEGVLAGIGKIVRIYRVGVHQLLKVCETRTIPSFVSYIVNAGNRIIVGDSAESFHFLKFDRVTNIITPFCDDATPRFPLSAVLLDDCSVACGDRFGNFTMLRLPLDVSDEADVDPSGVGKVWEHPNMCGTPNKLDIIANFHIGDPITGLVLTDTGYGLAFGTVSGQIGHLVPFRTDVDMRICRRLEIALQSRRGNVCGRIHEVYRSYYAPLRNVCDGDLLMSFLQMNTQEQTEIANEIGTTAYEIAKLLTSFDLYI